jgi:mono/diheme cytochrome c family protein
MILIRFCQIGLILMVLFCSLPGCGKSGADGTSATPTGSDPKMLLSMHCNKCHAQAGEPGGPTQGAAKGPSLAHLGSEPKHDVEWIAKYIRDSKSVKPDSKMPKFERMIRDDEILALAEHLAKQK